MFPAEAVLSKESDLLGVLKEFLLLANLAIALDRFLIKFILRTPSQTLFAPIKLLLSEGNILDNEKNPKIFRTEFGDASGHSGIFNVTM